MTGQLLRDEYIRILEHCERSGLSSHVVGLSRQWANGLFDDYAELLNVVPCGVAGKRVLDFGCKCGHLAPLLLRRGCTEVICVDAEPDYIESARASIGVLYPSIQFELTADGLLPLQPESVDLVLMNEVISHVNPAFLDSVFREVARVLVAGGMMFISDGNNAAHAPSRPGLVDLYEKWENGPDGARTDRDVVEDCFLGLRRKIIAQIQPGLPSEQVELLALNTSGIFGEQLNRVVADYVRSGHLVCRPYRKGLCPVNPRASGVVMERAFHPVQLELWLDEYGFDANQIVPRPSFSRTGVLGPLRSLYAWLRYSAQALRGKQWYRGAYEGFQIMAVKR